MTEFLAFLPFLVIVVCYELLPLCQLAVSSFTEKTSGKPGFENYIKIFTTPLYQQSIVNSVRISLISAAVGLVVAFFAADLCHEAKEGTRRRFTMLLNMMSNFSGVPLAFAFMVLMGNTGVLTLLGKKAGIPFLANFNLYSGNGLVLVYIYFQIPLATLLLLPSFSGLRPEWREAAVILKADPLDYWLRIAIPNLLPGILGTLSVLFANALAAFATAYAIVMNNYALLALQITSKYKGDVEIDKATGGALAMVLIGLMVLATAVNDCFTKKSTQGRRLV
ncbi:MAG: ABC transporter permease [Lachnospiraceae bacterium]|nr:ABC transporter permease [Lachnospiraceae bacterium]